MEFYNFGNKICDRNCYTDMLRLVAGCAQRLVGCLHKKKSRKACLLIEKIMLVTWYYNEIFRLIADVLKTTGRKFYRLKSVLNRLKLCVGLLNNQRQFQHGTHSDSKGQLIRSLKHVKTLDEFEQTEYHDSLLEFLFSQFDGLYPLHLRVSDSLN